ncbi:MAG: 3-hydroxyacyl-CoA dehydrogenase NAD-binding domain-containing protein [Mycobacteriales bacterium]
MSADPELVTTAKLQVVDVPRAGAVALITLDNGLDHRKPNTFGALGLASIGAAIDVALELAVDGRVLAIAITGKPYSFAAGADLTAIGSLTSYDDAIAVGRQGHAVFRRLADARVPTFAFINGAALGGGLEIALHCHYRTISGDVPAIALPECFLGLIPGWGGTQLLPRLIGIEAAVKVIVANPLSQNRMLKAPQACQLGVVDVLFEPADFLERSLAWAGEVATARISIPRRPRDTADQWLAVLQSARADVDVRVHGSAPAPYRALDLLQLARDADVDSGFAAEDAALADLIMSDELRASLYAFDLVRRRAKRMPLAPDPELARRVTKVGIVGAGLMASQLALLFAQRLEVPVVLTDVDDARLEAGLAAVHGDIGEQVARGRWSTDRGNRLSRLVTGSVDKRVFADADFVVEAVFEQLAAKQEVFGELEAIVSDTCVLASNTSSLSVTDMARGLAHPERVVGFHFFNPPAVLPLLEIARTPATDDATFATAFAVGKLLKKSCVPVADAPGFVVNRLLTRLFAEVLRAIDEGTDFDVADRALEPLGLPMSPLMLVGFTGAAVTQHVAESLCAAYPDRFYVSPNLRRVVAAGKASILTWVGGDPVVDPDVEALWQRPVGGGPDGPEVLARATEALCDEVRRLLGEGVVPDVRDVDLALLTGAGFPFQLGGITPYLDRAGISQRITGSRFHEPGVASLPT